MEYTLENEKLAVRVSDRGAELQSVFCKISKEEQLWQGDPAVWGGRSPLLFPIVGKLKNDSYCYQGVSYRMPKHGFARTSSFQMVRGTDSQLEFSLEDSVSTRQIYPFAFTLSVTYTLEERSVSVAYRVNNRGNCSSYYSLGAHPGFRCRAGDRLTFGQARQLFPRTLDEAMLLGPPSGPLELPDSGLELSDALFENDALIMTGITFSLVTLHRRGDGSQVRVQLGGAPCLGLWAKPKAPYVCIEPWFGVDDSPQATGRLEDKPYIQRLEQGESRTHEIHITISGG